MKSEDIGTLALRGAKLLGKGILNYGDVAIMLTTNYYMKDSDAQTIGAFLAITWGTIHEALTVGMYSKQNGNSLGTIIGDVATGVGLRFARNASMYEPTTQLTNKEPSIFAVCDIARYFNREKIKYFSKA